jgi:hypothetical protein
MLSKECIWLRRITFFLIISKAHYMWHVWKLTAGNVQLIFCIPLSFLEVMHKCN